MSATTTRWGHVAFGCRHSRREEDVDIPTCSSWPPLLLLQLPLLLLLANYHHCKDHTTTVINQTACCPTDIRPRKHPGKIASLRRSHHSSDHSDILPKEKEEHYFFLCRFANTHLPLCNPTAYSRTFRLHSLGSRTQAFMNWSPQRSSRCSVDQWDS